MVGGRRLFRRRGSVVLTVRIGIGLLRVFDACVSWGSGGRCEVGVWVPLLLARSFHVGTFAPSIKRLWIHDVLSPAIDSSNAWETQLRAHCLIFWRPSSVFCSCVFCELFVAPPPVLAARSGSASRRALIPAATV